LSANGENNSGHLASRVRTTKIKVRPLTTNLGGRSSNFSGRGKSSALAKT
jgi:hypothetical protein